MATLPTLILAVLIPLINAQITTRECVTDNECEKQDITADQIDCIGTESCIGASLTSRNRKNGYIDCSGSLSCNGAGINKKQFPSTLTASSNIYCSGFFSCSRTGEINSDKNIYCTGAQACMTDNPNTARPLIAGNNMYCYGHWSCYRSQIQIGKKAFCSGLGACFQAEITGGIALHCDAAVACQYSQLSDQRRFVCCAGSNGCSQSIISNVKEIRGYGTASIWSTINPGTEIIKAYGHRSLGNSIVDTDSNSIITIQV